MRQAALADSLPGQQHQSTRVGIERRAAGEPAAGVRALTAAASPELFGVFDKALLLGRTFGAADGREAPAVAIVNAAFARRFFGQRNPIGERFRTTDGSEPSPWIRIVGVADLQMNPSGAGAAGYYRPLAQTDTNVFRLAIRVDADPMTLPAAVKEAVKGVDPRIDIATFTTHEAMARRFLVSYELMSLMVGALGGTALFLAVAGLYAVMALSVARRTREIGIRVALGADGRRVMGVVMRQGVRQMAAGVILGGAAGWVLLRLLSLIPIGVSSSGMGLLAAAVATMLAAGLAACVGPAARAVGIRPVEALRHD